MKTKIRWAFILCLATGSIVCFSSSPTATAVREMVKSHPGLLLVFIGVAIEVVCDWSEMTGPPGRWKRIGASLLVLGLAVEVWEAVEQEKANLKLREKVALLEARIKDRVITKEQSDSFIVTLKDVKKGPILLGARHPDRETAMYAMAVFQLFVKAGFEIESVANYPDDILPVNEGSSIDIRYETTNSPAYLNPLFQAFTKAGIKFTVSSNIFDRPYSKGEGKAPPGKVLIMTVEKP